MPVSNTEEIVLKRIPIYNLHSGKNSPQRYCDLIIDGPNVYLEKKQSEEPGVGVIHKNRSYRE